MALFDVSSMDEGIDRDWKKFTSELADQVASIDPGSEISISPRFPSNTCGAQTMLVRTTVRETIVCAASGLVSPPAPWSRSETADGIHTLEDDAAWVDRFAAALVTRIRMSWNVPHPSFLVGPDGDARGAGPENPPTEGGLTESLTNTLQAIPDAEVEVSDGSFCVTTESVSVYMYVAGAEEVRIHSPIVEHISGRTRAAEVIADLNRRHPRLKFLLVEDRVHVALSVDAHPFVDQHVVNAIRRVSAFVSSVDDAFAGHLGGSVATGYRTECADADLGDEVPTQLMVLLELDARSGGAVGVDDIVSVCGADRVTISHYEAFCSEQAESWREYAREAIERGEPDAAADCEAEAVPWDRIVEALRSALRTVGFYDNASD